MYLIHVLYCQGMNLNQISEKFKLLEPFLNEKTRRIYAAAESQALGHGGVKLVCEATGISGRAIAQGRKELLNLIDCNLKKEAIRKKGGGRKKEITKHPGLKEELEKLVEPFTRGDPESPLKWTCKSTRKLSDELKQRSFNVSHNLVARLLKENGYSLQALKKNLEGTEHPDRNSQFKYIYEKINEFRECGEPVISVDTKKRELVGNFKNGGREYHPKGASPDVNGHDFENKELGHVCPYGIYDIGENQGFINLGIDRDTSEFAAASIRRWWFSMGNEVHPYAQKMLITADSGGSNGYRRKLWKMELQKLVNDINIPITVCHLPPGTSKWNKIEHRLFSFIAQNWRGKPLISHEVIINLIKATTTKKGLRVDCQLDQNQYQTGIKVTTKDIEKLNLVMHNFHGEWNYTIFPKDKKLTVIS